MELTCRQCESKFRAAVPSPLVAPVRLACPSCGYQMVLKPKTGPHPSIASRAAEARSEAVDGNRVPFPKRRVALVADEPRPFRAFLGDCLRHMGFEVQFFDTGDGVLDSVRRMRADLLIVNVYLKGKLGVEISEAIKADPALQATRVILIGALFRANRFRANPTNLYGADEYIEELIPEQEFREIIGALFPELGKQVETPAEPKEYDEARRLARLILSDIVIYHPQRVENSIRDNTFFDDFREEIEEGRRYYESRVPFRVRQDTEIYTETLKQFVQMKREELERLATGTR